MSRALIVVYTAGILINALSPLFLRLAMARIHQPLGIARCIRYALLFDTLFDTFNGFLPLGYVLSSFFYYYLSPRTALCLRAKSVGMTCSLLRNTALMKEASECAFGGRTTFAIFIKIKSRVVPLILGPKKVLTAFRLRHWVAAERGRVLGVARKVVRRFQHQSKTAKEHLQTAFHLLRLNGVLEAVGESKQLSDRRNPTAITPRLHLTKHSSWGRLKKRESEVRERIATHLQKARGLRHLYIPVPFWALALLVVPAVVCCVFVWVRVATAGQCDKGDVVFGDAPCIVQTFVSPVSSVPYNILVYACALVVAYGRCVAPTTIAANAVVIDFVKLTHIFAAPTTSRTHTHTHATTHIRLLPNLYSRFSTRGSAAAPTSTARAASSCYTSISISVGDAMTNYAIHYGQDCAVLPRPDSIYRLRL